MSEIITAMKGTKCKIATIRKCKGIVIEILTSQPARNNMFDTAKELQKKGYRVYSLRHIENDMSEPRFVTHKPILVNRFGWFITKDKMNFEKNDEIRIDARNSSYFDPITGKEWRYWWEVKDITVYDYLKRNN